MVDQCILYAAIRGTGEIAFAQSLAPQRDFLQSHAFSFPPFESSPLLGAYSHNPIFRKGFQRENAVFADNAKNAFLLAYPYSYSDIAAFFASTGARFSGLFFPIVDQALSFETIFALNYPKYTVPDLIKIFTPLVPYDFQKSFSMFEKECPSHTLVPVIHNSTNPYAWHPNTQDAFCRLTNLPSFPFEAALAYNLPHSRQGMHLWRLCQCADMNLIPDMEALRTTLLDLESSEVELFDFRPFTPPEARQYVRNSFAASNAAVAKTYFMKENLFDVRLEDTAPWAPYGGLNKEWMERFVLYLPEQMRITLLQALQYNHLPAFPEVLQFCDVLQGSLQQQCCVVKKHEKPKVTVLTLTRNHEDYIAQNIESVLAQKTNFPVEHIILDDASSDTTRDILSSYAAKYPSIKLVFIGKKLRNENVRVLFSRCHSQYAALCDGDDYFTDSCKLQKQVDYLDAHPECSLCFHQVEVVYEDGSGRDHVFPALESMPRGLRPYYHISDLFKSNFMQTSSVMYRWRFRDGVPDWFRGNLVPGDWYWHLLHAEIGKIGFLPDVMSVYRRHPKSLYYSTEDKESSIPHRILHGMRELDTYAAVNKHFESRYERAIVPLSNSVLADFLAHAQNTGDDTYLHEAGKAHPAFMEFFLRTLRVATH